MADQLITKRLLVSGITPAIRPADLSQKLGAFGTIKALDGFGEKNSLGETRKFGYVTIKTTQSKLARCMNLLSGVTWKGTKLRIGEAKPDFRERLVKERAEQDQSEPPRKRRRLPRGVQGVHAADMSLVTPENVQSRSGWKVTSSGRIYKPVRMRPEHPLPETVIAARKASEDVKGKAKGKGIQKKERKRIKLPPVRARRRTIDPVQWGSVHLKGTFLENVDGSVVERPLRAITTATEDESQHSTSEDEAAEEEEQGQDVEDEEDIHDAEPEELPVIPPPALSKQPPAVVAPRQTSSHEAATSDAPSPSHSTDLLQEKSATLGLLQSMFGNKDWGGEESLSDVEMDAVAASQNQQSATLPGFEEEIEEVPMDVDTQAQKPDAEPSRAPEPQDNPNEQVVAKVPPPSVPNAPKPTKLKDLFAPREESGGFSLLGHLDLDLDLDDDVLDASFTPAEPVATAVPEIPLTATRIQSSRTNAQITFDPTLPLFYPLSEEERAGLRGKVKDPLDVAREKGWDWRTFRRTLTSEQIRQRWEDQKVELTQDWKRRHREAVKSKRRRGGGDGD